MFTRIKNMRLRSLIGLALILLLGGYTLAGFVVLPLVMESLAPEKLSGYLKRPVSLKDLSFNPFSMTLVVEDLRVMEPHRQERFVACEKLRVDMQLTSGLKLKPKVER